MPTDPVAAFAAVLDQPDCRDALRELKAAEPEDPPRRPFDSHPGLAARLRNLARCADLEQPIEAAERAPSRWPWLDLGSLFMADLDHVRMIPVPVWLRLVARLRAPTAPVDELLDAAEELTSEDEATLDTVLDLLAAGRGWELAVAITDDPAEEHQTVGRLCDALFRVLAHALVGAGCGHWRLRWARPSELIVDELSETGVHSSDSTQLAEEVFAAVGQHREVDRLRFHLTTLGFNPGARITVETARPRRLRARAGNAEQERRDRRNVLVSGVISLAVAALVLLFGFGQRASMSPPSSNTQYTVVPLTNAQPGLPGPPRLTAATVAQPRHQAARVDRHHRRATRSDARAHREVLPHHRRLAAPAQRPRRHDRGRARRALVVPFLLAPPWC